MRVSKRRSNDIDCRSGVEGDGGRGKEGAAATEDVKESVRVWKNASIEGKSHQMMRRITAAGLRIDAGVDEDGGREEAEMATILQRRRRLWIAYVYVQHVEL